VAKLLDQLVNGLPEVGCLHRNLGVIEILKEPLEFLWLVLELSG
jgi:hypothetical protein